MTDTTSYLVGGLKQQLNALANRERRFQRGGLLHPAAARPRLLGGTIRTVRGQRPITGAESSEPVE